MMKSVNNKANVKQVAGKSNGNQKESGKTSGSSGSSNSSDSVWQNNYRYDTGTSYSGSSDDTCSNSDSGSSGGDCGGGGD